MKHIKTILGTGRPAEYFSNNISLPLKEALPLGTLVALDEATNTLIRADKTHLPIGVVHLTDVIGIRDKQYLDGERDTQTLKAGSHVPLYKQFLITGLDVKGTLKIGAPVYLGGEEQTAELTCTKPAEGFFVGTVERIIDKMVRFDLALSGVLKVAESKID